MFIAGAHPVSHGATIFSCEENARLVRQIAEARDAGATRDEVLDRYLEITGDRASRTTIQSLVESAYTLRSRNPSQLARDALASCDPTTDTGIQYEQSTKPLDELESLTTAEADWCVEQKAAMDRLLSQIKGYESELADYDSKRNQFADQIQVLDKPNMSDSEIEQFNHLVDRYNAITDRLRAEQEDYLEVSNSYNTAVEQFNQRCGGKKLPL